MGSDELANRLRDLPSVTEVAAVLGDGSDRSRVAAARRAIDDARARLRAGVEVDRDSIIEWARAALAGSTNVSLVPVLNATGVVIHTNLGRVPIGVRQLEAIGRVAQGYSNLEYDLDVGGRGTRHEHAQGLLRSLTGADRALVANNNAAILLVALAALCSGREVLVSRGELVEIGGEFRIPEILEMSGARLVEVGTTNRTHLRDYERAISSDTAAILKVHASNYKMVGFTASVTARELSSLAHERGLLLIYDVGSGVVAPRDEDWLAMEPSVMQAVEDGSDIVTFSGDKLLGGPQAGIAVGASAPIEKMARHPLMRAVRPDKLALAALEETLRAHLEEDLGSLPLWEMARQTPEALEARARALTEAILSTVPDVKLEATRVSSVAGGGSAPGETLSSWGLALAHPERTTGELERALRRASPPVVARIVDDVLVFDLRTIHPEQDDALGRAIVSVL